MRGETRKVLEASALWCRWPDEIEADFERFYPRLSLADWHRGSLDELGCLKLSSRKLLNLVRRLPEDSQFKTHAAPPFGRDGDWTELEEMTAQLHNAVARYVSGKFEDAEYTVFSSPRERVELAIEAAEAEEFQDHEFGKLMSRFGEVV